MEKKIQTVRNVAVQHSFSQRWQLWQGLVFEGHHALLPRILDILAVARLELDHQTGSESPPIQFGAKHQNLPRVMNGGRIGARDTETALLYA